MIGEQRIEVHLFVSSLQQPWILAIIRVENSDQKVSKLKEPNGKKFREYNMSFNNTDFWKMG